VIEHLAIERFKSILSLALPCRKVNVFNRAPDTGKSNILEALYLLSRLGWGLPLDSSLRLSGDVGLEALFYRQFLDQPIRISLRLDGPRPGVTSTELRFSAGLSGAERILHVDLPPAGGSRVGWGGAWQLGGYLDWIRYYVYSSAQGWQYRTDRPHGTAVVAGFGLRRQKSHAGGQGEVINRLLERGTADVGLVDEDPGRTHDRQRGRMAVVSSTDFREHRRAGERHLIVVKPDLERCFRRSMERLRLESQLPTQPEDLRRVLGVPGKGVHTRFRAELQALYEASVERRTGSRATDLERIFREIRR
jgi:hypothetical protein